MVADEMGIEAGLWGSSVTGRRASVSVSKEALFSLRRGQGAALAEAGRSPRNGSSKRVTINNNYS